MALRFSTSWMDNLPIFRKGLYLIFVPVLFQFSLIFVLWFFYQKLDEMNYLSQHSRTILTELDTLHAEATSGYNLSVLSVFLSDPTIRSEADHLRTKCQNRLLQLHEMTADNPAQQERTVSLKNGFNKLYSTLDQLVGITQSVREQSSNPENSTPVPIAKTVRQLLDESRSVNDQFEKELNIFRQAEIRLKSIRSANLERTLRKILWVVIGGYFILVIFAAAAFVLFRDSIAGRIKIITDNLASISKGNSLAPVGEGEDEIAQLDRAVHTLSTALNEKALETEMFLYSVSHDLRSPLVNLNGFTEELRFAADDLKTKLDAIADQVPETRLILDSSAKDFEKSFHFIKVAVARLSRIIDALIRLSRAGRIQYKNEAIELSPLVSRIVETFENTIREKKVAIHIEELPVVYGDESALEQVFANLIGNALAYLDPSRPGEIVIGRGNGPKEEVGSSIVFVRDNGLGISEASQKKLFLAFQRFHPKTNPGEGIGLALVRRVLVKLGGKIWCESTEGIGTTFFVSLPKSPDQRMELPSPSLEV